MRIKLGKSIKQLLISILIVTMVFNSMSLNVFSNEPVESEETTEETADDEAESSENSQEETSDQETEGKEEEESTDVTDEIFQNEEPQRNSVRAENIIDGSIDGLISTANQYRVVLIPASDVDNQIVFTQLNLEEALRNALWYLYENGNGEDYVLYLGNAVTASTAASTHIGRKTTIATSPNDVTFASLEGKIGTLVITSSKSDPLTYGDSFPSDATNKMFTLRTSLYLGTNVKFRNIRYSIPKIYAQGHTVTFDRGGGQTGGNIEIYGGTDSDFIGDTNLIINSTGDSETTKIYGGNESGILTGNANLTVNNTNTGAWLQIYGGNKNGTVDGDVNVVINGLRSHMSAYYAGGYTANVTGNVNNQMHNLYVFETSIYGGVYSGNIGGKITTDFKRDTVDTRTTLGTSYYFYGGSRTGNIDGGIESTVDFSNYAAGRITYVGGNAGNGIINGGIKNTVTAGEYNKGSLNIFYGGTSATGSSVGSDPATTAAIQIHGGITNEITKGSISYSAATYCSGAGRSGYITGDVTTRLGTEGLVYGRNNGSVDTSPSTTSRSRGNSTGTDFVAGGGNPGASDNNFRLEGNATLIQENVLLRWTYGGSYSGNTYGNTHNELHGGVVDTLEGGGYQDNAIYGDTSSKVTGGQVDWFFTPGSWSTDLTTGNVYAEIHGGTINAHIGGHYGVASGEVIQGNSTIIVTGGDFSGKPRTGSKTFSAGPSKFGQILGDTKLVLDFRNSTDTFTLPTATYISGGRPYGAGTGINIGSSTDNTVTLEIYTGDEDIDALNGAIIYGDGGSSIKNTAGNNIFINIDAPGSTIGTLYGTEYANALAKNVEININAAKYINYIDSGNGATGSNITNTVYGKTDNRAKITIGNENPIDADDKDIEIGTIQNFTDLTVIDRNFIIGTSVKNGRSVTASNYKATYSGFGNITLKSVNDTAGLILSSTGTAFGSKFMVEGEGNKMASPSGADKFIISEFEGDSFIWQRTGGAGGSAYDGTWFGQQATSHVVLTFKNDFNSALAIEPLTLQGYDIATPTNTYIGDNDASRGYGLAVAGSKIEYKVTKGEGTISHDIDDVSTGPAPVKVYGTVQKGQQVTEGVLLIPINEQLPTLTFHPLEEKGFWVQDVVETIFNGNSTNYGDIPNWTSPSNENSYSIGVEFSNDPKLYAQNAIINESEAKAITSADDIINYTKAEGKPFFTHEISADMISDIKEGLADGENKKEYEVTYKAGHEDNSITKTVKLIVISDDAKISENRDIAIYAEDATILLKDAQTITTSDDLASYTNVWAIDSEGKDVIAQANAEAITEINTATTEKTVEVTYTYDEFSIKVNVHLEGEAPVLTVKSPREVKLGETFNYMNGVTAWDAEDGDITNDVEYEETIDTSVAGIQKVTYKVTDSTSKTVEETGIVVVNDGSYVLGDKYILQARTFAKKVGDVTGTDAEILEASKAKVFDGKTGEAVDTQINVLDNGGYEAVAGTYNMILNVEEESYLFQAIRGIVIDADVVESTDEYVISANNFTINSMKASNIQNGEILSLSNAKGLEKSSLNPKAVEVEESNIQRAPGVYEVTLKLVDYPEVKAIIYVTVDNGDAPVITTQTPIVINVGGTFNYMEGVYATDTEDDAAGILLQILISGAVNTEVAGVYTLTYSVTDSDYNTTKATVVVVVNDGSYIIDDDYILKADNYAINVSEMDGTDPEIINESNAKAWDAKTGVPTTVKVMERNSYEEKAEGIYNIKLAVSNKDSVEKTIKARVVDGDVINIDETYVISARHAVIGKLKAKDIVENKNEIIPVTYAKAYNLETGDEVEVEVVTHTVEEEAGEYEATVKIKDVSDLTVIVEIEVKELEEVVTNREYGIGANHIRINTTDAATITNAKLIELTKAQGWEIETGNTEEVEVEGSHEIEVTPDIYEVTFRLVNYPNVKVKINVEVTDGNEPEIRAETPIVLEVGNGGNAYDYYEHVSATDVEDDAAGKVLEITYEGEVDVDTAGVYRLIYTVKDSDHNTASAIAVVVVNDGSYIVDEEYVIRAENYVIKASEVDELGKEAQIIYKSSAKGWSSTTGNPVGVKVSEDDGYTKEEGVYDIVLAIENKEEVEVEIKAIVIDADKIVEANGYVIGARNITIGTEDLQGMTDAILMDMMHVKAYKKSDGSIADAKVKVPYVLEAGKTTEVTFCVVDDPEVEVTVKVTVKELEEVVTNREYGIGANHIQINTTDAATITNDKLIELTKAEGWDLETGNTEEVEVDGAHGIEAIQDVYEVTFQLKEHSAVKVKILVKVTDGEAPVIHLETPTVINVGDTFDPMDGVSATDAEDDAAGIPLVVVPTGVVDTEVAKVYTLTYKVTDSDHNTTIRTRVVVVNDGSYVVDEDYIIRAQNFAINAKDMDVSDASGEILSKSKAQAWDAKTGDLVDTIVANNGGYKAKEEIYNIDIAVRNKQTVLTSIKAIVVDDDFATITDEYIISARNINIGRIDAQKILDDSTNEYVTELQEAKAYRIADVQKVDIIASHDVVSIDPTRDNPYHGTYKVADNPSVEVSARINIENLDIVITDRQYGIGADNFKINTNAATGISDEEVINYANVVAREKYSNILRPVEVDHDIIPVEGFYYPTFTIEDQPQVFVTVEVEVTNGSAPVITAETPKRVPLSSPFDIYDYQVGVSAWDEEDGPITNISVSGDEVKLDQVGVYVVTYSVIDSDYNLATKDVVVIVDDGTFEIGDDYIIKANNFVSKISDMDGSDTEILTRSGATVWDANTGQVINAKAMVKDNGGYTNTEDVYDIEIIAENQSIIRTIKAFVLDADVIAEKNEYIISAKHIEVGKDEADILRNDNEQLFDRMNVQAFDNITGEPVDASVVSQNILPISGVYPVTFKVNDDSTVKVIANVTVKDLDAVNTNKEYGIGANHIRINSYTADGIANEKLIELANAQGWELGTTNPADVQVKNHTIGTGEGEYDATFQLVDYPNVEIKIKVTVNNRSKPELTVTTPVIINVGDTFNYLDGVTAIDVEDGNIINDVQYTQPVDVNVAGVYTVEYSVEDSDHNIVTATRVVIVNDGSYVVDNDYIIQANNFYIKMSEMTGTNTEILDKSNAKAWSSITGEEVAVVVKNSGGYKAIEDVYTITLTAVDTNTALEKQIKAIVLDAEIIVENDNYVISARNALLGLEQAEIVADYELVGYMNAKAYNLTTGNRINNLSIDHDIQAIADDYPVTFSISQGTNVSVTPTLTVVDYDVVGYDRTYAIAANHISMNGATATGISDAMLINLTKANGWVIETGELKAVEVESHTIPDINQLDTLELVEDGVYNVTFQVIDRPDVKVTVEIVVETRYPIVNVEHSEYYMGDIFNEWEGVTAVDTNEQQIILTSQNTEIVHNIPLETNTNQFTEVGTYMVEYTVTVEQIDNSIIKNTGYRVIKVHGLPTIKATEQVYSVEDTNILDQVQSNPKATWLKANEVVGQPAVETAIDTIDYEVLSGPNDVLNFSEVGIYKVKYTAENPDGKIVDTTVEVLIEESNAVVDTTETLRLSANGFIIDLDTAKILDASRALSVGYGNPRAFIAVTNVDGVVNFTEITNQVEVSSEDLAVINNASEEGGIYNLTYRVEEDGKEVENTVKVVVVGTHTPQPDGDNLAITAKDIEISNNQAKELTGAKAKELSEVEAWLIKENTAVTNIEVDEVGLGNIRNVSLEGGVYELTFIAEYEGQRISTTIEVKVLKGEEGNILTPGGEDKGKESNVVNTGDQIAIYAWLLGLMISIGALVTKKRKKYE